MSPSPPIARAFRRSLLTWFRQNRRDLPWRTDRTPYRVWVSEIMLQQTRIDQSLDYYRRWMKHFPTVQALAKASLDEVLKCWEGLGYYARARNMHAAAQRVVQERQGHFPTSRAAWMELPGVGPYASAAIASLVCGEDCAAVDGNVKRVLCRVFAHGEDMRTPKARLWLQQQAQNLLPEGKGGVFNEAMMELGALVCRPRSPRCGDCPLRTICQAFKSDRMDQYPYRTPKKIRPHYEVGAGLVQNRKGEYLLAQRRTTQMLGGLWEFPGGKVEEGEDLPTCIVRELAEEMGLVIQVGTYFTTVEHAYSHFTISLHAWRARIVRGRPRCYECADYAWVHVSDIKKYALSRADQIILERLEQEDERGSD